MMIGEFDTTSCDTSGVLPAQMSVGVWWNGDTSGPRALMLAVVEDAAQCIEQGRRRRRFHARRLASDAEAWVRSNDRDWPFSFVRAPIRIRAMALARELRRAGTGGTR